MKGNIDDGEEKSLLVRNLAKLFKRETDSSNGQMSTFSAPMEPAEEDRAVAAKDLARFKWSNYSYKLLDQWKLSDFEDQGDTQRATTDYDMTLLSQYI